MANGRLGKSSVPSKRTEVIYTNNSGSEASVSLVATSPNGSNLYARIDDSNDAIETSTTLTTETFNDTYLRYIVKNTAWDDATPVYGGRMGLVGNGSLSTSFYDGTSTYQLATSLHNSFPSFSEVTAEKTGQYVVQNSSTAWAWLEYDSEKKDETILKAAWGHDTTAGNELYTTSTVVNNFSESQVTYRDAGLAIDPYKPYVVGVNTSGSMTVGYPSGTGMSFVSETTGSSWYQRVGTTASTDDYQKLRLMNGVFLMDGGSQAAGRVYIFDTKEPEDPIDEWLDDSDTTANRLYYMDVGAGLSSGNIAWFEYNPNDGYWYVGFRDNSTSINSVRFAGDFFDNGLPDAGRLLSYTASNGTYGWEWLSNDSITEQTAGQFYSADWTFTSKRVGESLWALYGSKSDATDIWLSDDLKTWKTVSDYYGSSYKYEAIEGDTVVSMASSSTDLIALRTNIGSVGEDGILEQGQDMIHLERSGLVVNDGDRFVVFNQGSNPISVQIMGYEGN